MKHFLKKTGKHFSTQPWPGCNEFLSQVKAMGLIAQNQYRPVPDQLPAACSFLGTALESQNSISLVQDFSRIAANLTWREAPKGKLSELMDGRHAHCEIVGPDSDLPSDQLRMGAFILAPKTHYPMHSHAAEEVYLPISGYGEWKIHQLDYVVHQPGSIIHINSWEPHAIRSRTEPLLMLWAWLGDIDFACYRLEEDKAADN